MADAPTDRTAWTEPGAHSVADGIHRIPLPLPTDGLRAVNVYAIETEQGLTLVDGGWAIEASRRQLDSSLAAIGRSVRDITSFLVTHAHRDHHTQADAVRREVGSHVSLGLGDRATLELVGDGFASDPTVRQLERAGARDLARRWARFAERAERPDPSTWEPPDTWLDGDQRLTVGDRTIDAVSTPGHTQGHFVFADLDVFNASLASMEAMAHLELLVARGSLARTDDDAGAAVYRPTPVGS